MTRTMKLYLLVFLLFIINVQTYSQWQGSNLFYGNVRCIYVDGDNLFAATDYSLYKSVDNGENWSGNLIPTLSFQIRVSSIARCGKSLYLAGWVENAIGVLRSSDDGDTWTPIKYAIQNETMLKTGASLLSIGDSLFVGSYGESSIYLLTEESTKLKKYFFDDPSKLLTANFLEKIGNVIFAGTTTDGIYRSMDMGVTWKNINNGLIKNRKETQTISVMGDTLIIGTKGDSTGNFLFFSTDFGESWKNMDLNLPVKYEVISSKVINGALYVSGYIPYKTAIYKTTDFGNTWKFVSNPFPYYGHISLCFFNNALYSGIDNSPGIYKSANDGISWAESGLKNTTINSFTFNDSKKYLYLGTDRGEILQKNMDRSYGSLYNSLFHGFPEGTSCLSLKFQTTVLYAGTNKGFYYLDSPDQLLNKEWTQQNDSLSTDSVISIVSAENYNRLYLGTNVGVYTTDYFTHPWIKINDGLTNLRVKSLIISGESVFAATEGGVFALTYPERTWHPLLTGLSGNSLYVKSITLIGNYIFIGTKNGVYKATYTKPEWVLAGLPDNEINFVHAFQGVIFAATKTGGIFYTYNYGDTWQPLYSDSVPLNVLSLTCDLRNVWAIAEGGWFYNCSFGNYKYIFNINFNTQNLDQNKIILNWTTPKEVNSKKFEIQREFDFEKDFATVGSVPSKGNSMYPTNYTYTDSLPGIKFSRVNYRLKQYFSDGSYSYTNTSEITDIKNDNYNDQVYSYQLYQNYPNPFNPSTTIKYSIRNSGIVKLEVFDVLGRRVKTLVNEYKSTGSYNYNLDLRNLPSGVYMYRLNINGKSFVKNMILAK